MNYAGLISLMALALALAGPSGAQERIYRCGNEYTNTVPDAKNKGCKLMEGGNVTVVQANRPAATAPPRSAVLPNTSSGPRVDSAEQKLRDADARQILESELKKSQARQAELQAEYHNGEPERRGDETRNYQKYLDRVAELKSSLARIDSDIAGIRRELGRLGANTPAPAAK